MQRPYWWPIMTRDIQSFIKQINGIMPTRQKNESTKADWRTPIVDYLIHGTTEDRHPFEQENRTYFMEEGELRKEVDYGESKICIAGNSIKHLIKRVHEQNDYHLNTNDTIQQIINGLYIAQDTEHYINGECPRRKKKATTKIQCGAITTDPQEDWRTPFIDYLSHGRLTTPATTSQRQQISIRSRPFKLINGEQLIKEGADGIKRRCLSGPITEAIIAEAHEGIAREHFAENITIHKI
jgi:hypothetical protein